MYIYVIRQGCRSRLKNCSGMNSHTGLCRAADHPAIAAASRDARDVVGPTLPLSSTTKLTVDGVEPIDLCIVKSGRVRV